MTQFLSLFVALGMLVGVVTFATHSGDRVSFVELGAAGGPPAVAPMTGSAAVPG